MPKVFKRSRRRFKRRRFARRIKRRIGKKSRGPSTAQLTRYVSGFPDRVKVKLNYSDTYVEAQSTGVASYQVWRGNSIYDPDFTGVGHKPYGTSQWTAMYSYYRVYGSKIQVNAVPYTVSVGYGSVQSVATWYAVVPSLASAEPSYPGTIDEMPYVSFREYNTGQAGARYNVVKKYMSTAKIFGQPRRDIDAEDNYASITSNNPNNVWFWQLILGSIEDLSSSLKWTVTVKITYYVEFFRRQNLAGS